MNRETLIKSPIESTSKVQLAVVVMVLFCLASPVRAQISLGTLSSFGVLAGSTVTNTGATNINGDVGVSAGAAIIGFPPGVVTGGALHSNDAAAVQAQSDLTAAYDSITPIPCNTNLTGTNLGGLTLTPGVYCFSTSAQLTGTLFLDGLGDPNASFVFKIGSTLTTASSSRIFFTNSASGCNLFWQVGSSATLGTGSSLAGNILALTSITLTTGANTSGRVLARNGAVTLDSKQVSACGTGPTAASVPAVSTWGLMFLILALPSVALGMRRFRRGTIS